MAVDILITIILPIFVIIGVGYAADRALKIDLQTLSKLNFYITLPALILIKTLDAGLSPALYGTVVLFTVIQFAVLLVICRLAFRARPLKRHATVLTLGAVFYNAGNFGLPLAQLAFGSQGTGVLAIVMMVQNFLTFTWGVWLMDVQKRSWRRAALDLLKVPVLWAVVAAVALGAWGITLPPPIYTPLSYLGDATIPLALMTLGIQLSRSRLFGELAPLTAAAATRLLLSPALALLMVGAWAIAVPGGVGEIGPVLIVAAGLPVAVNVYILSVEYQRDATLASQMVVWTTLLSAITLTGWLLAVK